MGWVTRARTPTDDRPPFASSPAARAPPRLERATQPRAKKGRQLKQIDPPSRSRGRRGRRSPRSRRANDARARRGRSSRRDRATADVHAAGSTRSGRGFFLSSVRSAVARTYDLRELLVHGLAVDVRLLEERGRFLERILERHRASRGSSTRARSSVARRRSAQTFLNQFASRSRPAPKNHYSRPTDREGNLGSRDVGRRDARDVATPALPAAPPRAWNEPARSVKDGARLRPRRGSDRDHRRCARSRRARASLVVDRSTVSRFGGVVPLCRDLSRERSFGDASRARVRVDAIVAPEARERRSLTPRPPRSRAFESPSDARNDAPAHPPPRRPTESPKLTPKRSPFPSRLDPQSA